MSKPQPQPFIYVFLKNESGITISLIHLFSNIPIKQNHKAIIEKTKLPKNKTFELYYKGRILSENKSFKEEDVPNYGDIFVKILSEEPLSSRIPPKNDKNSVVVLVNSQITAKKPNSVQPQVSPNQATQIQKPNWTNFAVLEIIANKNVMPATVDAMLDESICLSGPSVSEKKSPKKISKNITNLTKNIKNLGVDKKTSENEKNMIKKITRIQAVYKGKKTRKIYMLRVKKLKYRVFVIEELIQSEEKYKNSLLCLKNNVILKLREKKLLKKEDEYTVFSNLENIAELSHNLHLNLNAIYKGKFLRYQTKIAEIILKMMPYFKLYTPFFNNFEQSRQFLEKLRKTNKPLSAFLNENEHKPQFENLDLSSLLIKPIQRMPKYMLLFKDLKKNTEESHPDYPNILQALEKFEIINNDLNSQMKEYLRKIKIYELQQLYGEPNKLQILESHREFLEEEAINIILADNPLEGIIYFLTDLLIVAGRVNNSDWKLLKAVFLEGNSSIREQQDTEYYQNIFTVYGKETMTLCTDTKENKEKLMAGISRLIKELKNRMRNREGLKRLNKGKTIEILKKFQENPLDIKVIGSIKRGLKDFSPYTVYVIQISKENWRQCLYFRYSELLKLDELVKKEFRNIGISHFPPKNWLNGQKAQVIESRKLLIEPFLQSLLQNEKVIDNCKKVLNFLGLPLNFYEISNNLNVIRLFSKKNSIFLSE